MRGTPAAGGLAADDGPVNCVRISYETVVCFPLLPDERGFTALPLMAGAGELFDNPGGDHGGHPEKLFDCFFDPVGLS